LLLLMEAFRVPLRSSVCPRTSRSGTRLPVQFVRLPHLSRVLSSTPVKEARTVVADRALATPSALLASVALVLYVCSWYHADPLSTD
jgi:hypothetical protein